jgi:hypothetical protein
LKEGIITGIITNKSNGLPVEGAIVRALDYESEPSDAKGKYLLEVPFGYGYDLIIMSGKYETFSINGINVPEYEPVKSLDIQLTSVPIEYTIRDIVPNPNPIISTTMQGGEIHRYYRVVNNYNGNPLSLVPIEVISENYLQVFSSNEDGILDICIQSNKIGNGLPNSTKKFIVQKVNNEILELPIQFDTKVISRSYSRYFDGSRYLKLGGNLLGLNIDALKLEMGGISCLQVDEEFSQQPEKIQILRQGKATMEDLGFKVKSPGFKGKIGPVHAGAMAEAGGGISFTGLMEDEYIYPYITENDYQAIAKYILIADGNYNLLDNTLIRFLTLCEILFTDEETLLEGNVSDAIGIEVAPKVTAEAFAGVGNENNCKIGLFAEAGAKANSGFKLKFNYKEQQIETLLRLSGKINASAGAGIKINTKGILKELDGKFHIYETEFNRGIQIALIIDNNFNIKEVILTFLSRNILSNWEEEAVYKIYGDQVGLIIQDLLNNIKELANLKNAPNLGMNIFVNARTFQNILDNLFTLVYLKSTSLEYSIKRTEITKKSEFDLEIELSGTVLAGKFGAGVSFEDGNSMIIEEGKWALGKNFITRKYNQQIPQVPVNFKDLMQKTISETPNWARSFMGDFRWLLWWEKSTQEHYLLSDNGSYLDLPIEGIPEDLDSLSVTSWSWYGGAPDLKSANISSKVKEIAERNRARAEEIYGMQYGIGGFYQFEPYGTTLLDTAYVCIKYDLSELGEIDENTLKMYYEDKTNKQWVYIGGTVDNVDHSVTAPVKQLGLFTLAPSIPYGEFGLYPSPNSIYADSISICTVTSDTIFNNDHSVVTDGTLFTIGLSHGKIITTDSNTTNEGIQIPVQNGKLNFQIQSSYLAGIAAVHAYSVNGSASGKTQIVYYDTIAPSKPIILDALRDTDLVVLNWKQNPEEDLAGYIIYYDTDTVPPYDGVHTVYGEASPIIIGNDTTKIISELLKDTTYYFAISAYDASGNESIRSNFIQAKFNKATLTIPLVSGWNYISFNVIPEVNTLSEIMNYNKTNNDEIKTANISGGSKTYFEGQWWEKDEGIKWGVSYKLHAQAANPGVIEVTGDPAPLGPLSLVEGWNYLGYCPQVELDANIALSEGDWHDNDNIKTSNLNGGSAEYFGDKWWINYIMKPGVGYMMKLSNAKTFSYNSPQIKASKITIENGNSYWEYPVGYQYSMGAHIAVNFVNGGVERGNLLIGAFKGGVCLGTASEYEGPFGNQFKLLIENELENDEKIVLKLYDTKSQRLFELSKDIIFTNDSILGTIDKPLVYTIDLSNEVNYNQTKVSVYPNPFYDALTFEIFSSKRQGISISLFDINGRKVADIYDNTVEKGLQKVTWGLQDSYSILHSGIYTCIIKAEDSSFVKKVVFNGL